MAKNRVKMHLFTLCNYALEVVILGHGEGEFGWLGVGGVVADNYALEVVILGHG